MFDFDSLSRAMVRQTVLCVGDLMLDEFVYGEVSRISPEAPASVLAVKRNEANVGGAGNVARNIAALGARCIFVSLVGNDGTGEILKSDLAKEELIEASLIVDSARPTPNRHAACALKNAPIQIGSSGSSAARYPRSGKPRSALPSRDQT